MLGHTDLMEAMRIDCAKVAASIVEFLRQKMSDDGKNGICLGISGGVDSAVTAKLAVMAVKEPSDVHGMYLPDQDSDEKYRKRAVKLASELKISFQIVDFSNKAKAEGIYDAPILKFLRISSRLNRLGFRLYKRTQSLLQNSKKHEPDTTSNGQDSKISKKPLQKLKRRLLSTPRIRWGFSYRHITRRRILEKYAEEQNLLSVGAANKSELFTGFFVTHGIDDLPVAPILGLYKNQVFQLAEYLNIPREITNAVPSPDMLKGMRDEDVMGVSYDKIDKVAYVVEHDLPKKIAFQNDISPKDFQKIILQHQSTASRRINKHEFPVFE